MSAEEVLKMLGIDMKSLNKMEQEKAEEKDKTTSVPESMFSEKYKVRNRAYRYRNLKKEKSHYGKNRKERREGRKEYLETCRDLREYRLYNRDMFRGDVAERKANQKERSAREDAERPTEPRYTGWTYTEDNPYYYNESYDLMEQDGILLFREYFDGTTGRATEEDYAIVYGYGGREMISDPLTTKISDRFHFVQEWKVI